jgi:hypothetical protein
MICAWTQMLSVCTANSILVMRIASNYVPPPIVKQSSLSLHVIIEVKFYYLPTHLRPATISNTIKFLPWYLQWDMKSSTHVSLVKGGNKLTPNPLNPQSGTHLSLHLCKLVLEVPDAGSFTMLQRHLLFLKQDLNTWDDLVKAEGIRK